MKQALQAPLPDGGLAKPDFYIFLASQLSYVYYWLHPGNLSGSMFWLANIFGSQPNL